MMIGMSKWEAGVFREAHGWNLPVVVYCNNVGIRNQVLEFWVMFAECLDSCDECAHLRQRKPNGG